MGFIDNYFRDIIDPRAESSFADLTEVQLNAHMKQNRYGAFELTEAIRPAYDLTVVPTAGYRHDRYQNKQTGETIPVIMAAATRNQLLDLFYELLDPLGDEVDVVLETNHDPHFLDHQDLYREHIDLPVLKSTLQDFEDVLLDDGCAGIAVLNPDILEVQFNEHKLLIMYGQDLKAFEDILRSNRIECRENIRFIHEGEHIHCSSDELQKRFRQLQAALSLDNIPREDDDPFADTY